MPTTDSPQSRSRLPHWGWFLLATAILVVVYAALWIWIPYHREQQIVQKINGWGGNVDTSKGGSEWLRRLVGDERMKVFDRVSVVYLHGITINDADLAHLSGLTNLEFLSLGDTQVSDAGLVCLGGMTKLKWLSLNGTQVSDVGLVHLSGLTNLEFLTFNETQVSDSGLPHLSKLTNLRRLDLSGTQFTDEGVDALQKALPDCKIMTTTR